jgi:hypothetical protein
MRFACAAPAAADPQVRRRAGHWADAWVAVAVAVLGCGLPDDVVGVATVLGSTTTAATSPNGSISAATDFYQDCDTEGVCGCGITCGYGSRDVPPDGCGALVSCDYTCPAGGCGNTCEIDFDDRLGCTLECPGGDCTLTCQGTGPCRISVCTSGCQVLCNGASPCDVACDAADDCSIIP